MMALPNIDIIVGIFAVLHAQPTFTTLDVAEWLRKNQPNTNLASKSNSGIGGFLSQNRSLLLIESAGSGGSRGHVWRRSLAGNAAAMLLFLFERGAHRQALRLLNRLRPGLADQYDRIAANLAETKPSRKSAQRPSSRTPRSTSPIADPASVAWDDKRLSVKSDPALRARYRRLQSWYRETQLGVPPGRNDAGRLVGSMVDLDASIADPGLNFLDADITAYVDQRLPEITATGGAADPHRLRRNMLSSQPLCFNLFGGLRADLPTAAAILSDVLDLKIDVIEEITVEYAPLPTAQYLADRTAFDAFIVYRTHEGERGFVGVETKYTEPFSPTVYTAALNPRYSDWTTPEHGFKEGAVAKLEHKSVNQLWRNALLAVALRSADGYDRGHVAVLGLADDTNIAKAVKGLSTQHSAPRDLVRAATLEALAERTEREPELAAWAQAFRRRYLDLSPVNS